MFKRGFKKLLLKLLQWLVHYFSICKNRGFFWQIKKKTFPLCETKKKFSAKKKCRKLVVILTFEWKSHWKSINLLLLERFLALKCFSNSKQKNRFKMFLEEKKNNIMAYDLQDLRYNIILAYYCLRTILYLTNFPLCVVVALQLTESCTIFILPEYN